MAGRKYRNLRGTRVTPSALFGIAAFGWGIKANFEASGSAFRLLEKPSPNSREFGASGELRPATSSTWAINLDSEIKGHR